MRYSIQKGLVGSSIERKTRLSNGGGVPVILSHSVTAYMLGRITI
jgi:hypothetical protein